MSRSDYLIIAVVAICLAALIFLVYEFSKLSKEREPELPETPLFEQEDNFPLPEEMDTALYEDYPATSDTLLEETTPVVPPPKTPAKPTPKPTPAPTVTLETPSGEGDYLVLAGAFRQQINAEAMLRQVRKKGYPQATISPFNRGAYAAVLVDRFTTDGEAEQLAQELRRKGIDAYVQKKR
jgi:cell division septation protein DedD